MSDRHGFSSSTATHNEQKRDALAFFFLFLCVPLLPFVRVSLLLSLWGGSVLTTPIPMPVTPGTTPTVGNFYNLVCPSCFTTLQFKCENVYQPRIKCDSCATVIDLRDASVVEGVASPSEVLPQPVVYSPEVELDVRCSGGGSALEQVAAVMQETTERNALPAAVSIETTTAATEERAVALSQKLSFLHFVTHTIEFFLFGTKPYCKIGHIRVFRKKIPFLGYRYIPVPRTSTSYSAISSIVFYLFLTCWYAVRTCDQAWLYPYLHLLAVLVFVFFVDVLVVAYTDPGFILPGYLSGDENGGNQILDRDAVYQYSESKNILQAIDKDKRDSKWQVINGVSMERKWCSQCKMYRPVRAAHCYQCGLCVQVHDHHCVVTGGCVGRRNILFFAYFVTEGHMTACLGAVVTSLSLYYHGESFSALQYWFLVLGGICVELVLIVITLNLAGTLWYNMFMEVTTRERLQNVYFSKKNPFQRQWYKNIVFNVFKKKHEPSIFREEVMSLWAAASSEKKNAMHILFFLFQNIILFSCHFLLLKYALSTYDADKVEVIVHMNKLFCRGNTYSFFGVPRFNPTVKNKVDQKTGHLTVFSAFFIPANNVCPPFLFGLTRYSLRGKVISHMADEEQRNKSHKGKTVGNKAAKKDEYKKRKAGIDLEPNRGHSVKAFQGPAKGSHKAQKFFRSVEKKETVMHLPSADKTLSHILTEPPLLVAVVGPPGVGKTTFIRSMVKFYSGRSLHSVRGPITVIAGKARRVTFMECPNDLKAMCDIAKVVDYVFLMIDGSYGLEMETFEFLSIAQIHGMPKMCGVVTHLDQLKTGKALKKRRKFLRHRFWHEVAAGAKVMCFAPMIRGLYRPNDVLNVHRMLITLQPKIQLWRNTHSCVLVDRHEDITDPDLVHANPNVSRTIAFYGYARGKPLKPGQLVHIPGLGDFNLEHLSRQDDPCFSETAGTTASAGKSVGHRMRHLSLKQKKLYAPYCDVGGISYDEDAIYISKDADMEQIERSGEGVELLRQLQTVEPMDASKTPLHVVRRPVEFMDEDEMEVKVVNPTMPSDDSDSSGSDAEYDNDPLTMSTEEKDLSDFGVAAAADESDEEAAAGEEELAPRRYNDVDSVRQLTPKYQWDPESIQRIKNLFVTGNWQSGEGEGEEEAKEGDDKGYESDDEEFDAAIRGATTTKKSMKSSNSDSDGSSLDDEEDVDRDDNDEEDESNRSPLKLDAPKPTHAVDALAGVGYSSGTRFESTSSAGLSSSSSTTKKGKKKGQQPSAFEMAFSGVDPFVAAAEKPDDDDYDILAEKDDDSDTEKNNDTMEDEELNNLVAGFLQQEKTHKSSPSDLDGIAFSPDGAGSRRTTVEQRESALESAAVMQGGQLTEEQERLLQKKMAKKKLFDESYDTGDVDNKNMTHSAYHKKVREVEEKKAVINSALEEMGDDIDRKIDLVGYFSGLYVRFVIKDIPAEFLRYFDPCLPLFAGGLNAGENEHQLVVARIKRHRWYPKILKAQDPLLISMGWRRFQTQPIFATEDPNGRCRYLKYTPLHMHCLASFYAPVTPPNTGFLALPIRNHRIAGFRIPCTGYTIGNDSLTSIVKKLKLTGTPAKVEKTTAFIKGMFSSDLEAAKFVGAKLRCVSGVRGIIKAVPKGKNGLVRATFEDKIFPSDIVFIRSWTPVEPPRYCAVQRNLVDPEWVGMRTMRELRWEYGVPLPENKDSEYREIKRRHRVAEEDEDFNQQKVMISRNVRLGLPFEMKEEFVPLKQTNELRERMTSATTVAPEARERRRQALLDALEDKADVMQKKRDAAKKRARERASKAEEKETEEYLRGLKKAKKETARRAEFRSQHKSRH
eukprot:gene8240-5761_t